MRGIGFGLIITISLGIIAILIVVGFLFFLGQYSGDSDTDIPSPRLGKLYYDYSDLLLSSDAINIMDLQDQDKNQMFCEHLKECIKTSILTGYSCEVEEFAYGSDLDSVIGIPLIGDCDDEVLKLKIAEGIEQKICEYKRVWDNERAGIFKPPLFTSNGAMSDAGGLSYENCWYNEDATVRYDPNDSIREEIYATGYREIPIYFSPDYFYNRGSLSDYYNGAGRMKIVVGKATVDNEFCKFTIYLCPQPAIASSETEPTIEVFDIIRNLRFKELINIPYYINDVSSDVENIGGMNVNAYYYNKYVVDLGTREYDAVTIINAIKMGFYRNLETRDESDHWYQPHWDIKRYSIYEYNDCWDSSFDNQINFMSESWRSRSIYYNCGDDNKCTDEIILKIATRRDYTSDNNYFSTIVTFCDA